MHCRYPTNASSLIARFYERAGKVTCLGSPNRTGSVAILATVSGDWDDAIVENVFSHTKVHCMYCEKINTFLGFLGSR